MHLWFFLRLLLRSVPLFENTLFFCAFGLAQNRILLRHRHDTPAHRLPCVKAQTFSIQWR